MRILFLDDSQNRHDKFKRNTIGCIVDHTYSVAATISALRTNSYDYVFLDHDLVEFMHPLEDTENGMIVVDWITDNKEKFRNVSFVVHSLNQPRGTEMKHRLWLANLNVQHKPGAWEYVEYDNKQLKLNDRWHILEDE